MNILLDVLAYNTHYLGFNANMLANEMYLDSADQRSSVVSLAKQVGYIFELHLQKQLLMFLSMTDQVLQLQCLGNKIYKYG